MILVTGATGLVGSQVVFDLVQSGTKLRALHRASSIIPQKLLPYSDLIEWKEADITDIFSLEDALEDIDQVYHCAASVTFDPKKREQLFKVNGEGTANLVNLCLEKKNIRLLHVSSIAAVGRTKPGINITEDSHWEYSKKASAYSISKYESEREVWRGIIEGLDAVIVNPSLILGDSSIQTGSHRLFQLAKKGMKFYTDGVVGMVDVRDLSAIMIQLMNSGIKDERFIVSAENVSYQKFFTLASREFGKDSPRIHASAFLLGLAWRAAKLSSMLTGQKPGLTKDTAKTSMDRLLYSNEKITHTLPVKFRPIEETIQDICKTIE